MVAGRCDAGNQRGKQRQPENIGLFGRSSELYETHKDDWHDTCVKSRPVDCWKMQTFGFAFQGSSDMAGNGTPIQSRAETALVD
ncbi:hypothetical protein DSM3645_02148 [Blastopirellula marina DSM 3645]|uniref:Uncharacterized protein n=1 Tax=Blastopirellula marina DSM 3645 TaxID=314230 RepID=A3ZV93_9BACT|nr:hypothetical protein DSM3645_02148 [Blastopirellula marina DSM 3645]